MKNVLFLTFRKHKWLSSSEWCCAEQTVRSQTTPLFSRPIATHLSHAAHEIVVHSGPRQRSGIYAASHVQPS